MILSNKVAVSALSIGFLILTNCGNESDDKRIHPSNSTDATKAIYSCQTGHSMANGKISPPRACSEYKTAGKDALDKAKKWCEGGSPWQPEDVWNKQPCSRENLVGYCEFSDTVSGFFADVYYYYKDEYGINDRVKLKTECEDDRNTWHDP